MLRTRLLRAAIAQLQTEQSEDSLAGEQRRMPQRMRATCIEHMLLQVRT